MKTMIMAVLLTMSLIGTAKAADKNLLFFSAGTQTIDNTETLKNSTTDYSFSTKGSATSASINYLRKVDDVLYLGLSVGNNNSKAVLMGFSF